MVIPLLSGAIKFNVSEKQEQPALKVPFGAQTETRKAADHFTWQALVRQALSSSSDLLETTAWDLLLGPNRITQFPL